MSNTPSFRHTGCLVGINPIAWSNDDFRDLGDETPLRQCLDEMRAADYAGTELGHKFPTTAAELSRTLAVSRLRLVSGWHSTFLALKDFDSERTRFLQHLRLLKACGATVVIVAECSHCTHSDPDLPLEFTTCSPALSGPEWARVYSGLAAFADLSAAEGLNLVYHHHMGTVVQREAELHELLAQVPPLSLLYDTGHLSFAGIDPLPVLKAYGRRIAHVHLKNVRLPVVRLARAGGWSFARSVRAGVFTVPGDDEGGVDFPAVFRGLAGFDYQGWLVVEAEQDPAKANPLRYALLAREFIRTQIEI